MTDLKKIENEVKDHFIPVFHEYVSSVTEDDSIYVVYDENHDRGEEKSTGFANVFKKSVLNWRNP